MIRIENLRKAYGENTVLQSFNAAFPEGETGVLMGASGNGKTTLLRLVLGLEVPDAGTISGVPKRCAAVFQEDRLCPQLSALGNVVLAAGRKKTGEARETLCALGLGESLDVPASELSGGMRRRVALARALCTEYDLLVLDEPFKGLDSENRAAAMETVRRRAAGKTILLATHDDAEAAFFGGNVYRIP